MKTQLPPESLESRIAPASVSGLGDDFVGPAATAGAGDPVGEAPQLLQPDGSVIIPRSGNIDLSQAVTDIVTVPVFENELEQLSAASAEAVQGLAGSLGILATSALGGESKGIGESGIDDSTAPAGLDATSPLESGAASIADLVLVKTGGFAGANPESLLIVKV